MIPDVEAMVGTVLRDDESVAEIAGDRVGGRTPTTIDDPWIRITQIADEKISRGLIFVRVDVQVDCFGSSNRANAHAEASQLARYARAALDAMPEIEFEDAVVSAVQFGPMSRVPDGSMEPERERFVFRASVFVK